MNTNDCISLGKIVHAKANLYYVHSQVFVGKKYVTVCPKCSKELFSLPEKEGICKIRCTDCNIVIGYTATKEPEEEHEVTLPSLSNGFQEEEGLLQWGKWPKRRVYHLHIGENIVGRKDNGYPCDAEIDDPFASRRSVNISVRKDESGRFLTILTVCHATNPLYLNGRVLSFGESLQLKFGDTVTIGKTKIKFKKSKK